MRMWGTPPRGEREPLYPDTRRRRKFGPDSPPVEQGAVIADPRRLLGEGRRLVVHVDLAELRRHKEIPVAAPAAGAAHIGLDKAHDRATRLVPVRRMRQLHQRIDAHEAERMTRAGQDIAAAIDAQERIDLRTRRLRGLASAQRHGNSKKSGK